MSLTFHLLGSLEVEVTGDTDLTPTVHTITLTEAIPAGSILFLFGGVLAATAGYVVTATDSAGNYNAEPLYPTGPPYDVHVKENSLALGIGDTINVTVDEDGTGSTHYNYHLLVWAVAVTGTAPSLLQTIGFQLQSGTSSINWDLGPPTDPTVTERLHVAYARWTTPGGTGSIVVNTSGWTQQESAAFSVLPPLNVTRLGGYLGTNAVSSLVDNPGFNATVTNSAPTGATWSGMAWEFVVGEPGSGGGGGGGGGGGSGGGGSSGGPATCSGGTGSSALDCDEAGGEAGGVGSSVNDGDVTGGGVTGGEGNASLDGDELGDGIDFYSWDFSLIKNGFYLPVQFY